MKSGQRRVKTIELSLTPQQIVLIWLRETKAGFSFDKAAQHKPPHRGVIANKVSNAVQHGMKGQPEAIIERAVTQARREADLLYILAVNLNLNVLQARNQREREYMFLLGHLGAELRSVPTTKSVELLRMTFLAFIKVVLILETAVSLVTRDRFCGEPVLFRDTGQELEAQIRQAADLSAWFNEVAVDVGSGLIDLDKLREDLRSEADSQISDWVRVARLEGLVLFGTVQEFSTEVEEGLRFFNSNNGRTHGDFSGAAISDTGSSAGFLELPFPSA